MAEAQVDAFCRIAAGRAFNPCSISCQPLAKECDAGETDVSSNAGPFSCVPEGEGLYAEACAFLNDYVAGLGCFTSAAWECEDVESGWCLPYRDLQAPDCPNGLACTAFIGEGAPRG